jgi:polyhydroxybutyrate depolymerase
VKNGRIAIAAGVLLAASAILAIRGRGAVAPHEIGFGSFDAGERPTPVKSDGCGKPAALATTISVGGEARAFDAILPRGYDEARPYPLVLAFHGNSGHAAFQALFRLEDEIGDRAVVVYPRAVVRRVWGEHFAPHWGRVDDLPFFDALVAQMKATLCIDERRVFAVGWSSGGYFANQLGCVRPDTIRAFASIAGGGPEDATCTKPVPAFFLHDENDPDVVFSTGVASRDAWLGTNRCSAAASSADGCILHTSCAAPVVWCATSGNGHSIPPSARVAIASFLASF